MATAIQESKSYLYVEGDNNESVDVLEPVAGDVLYSAQECAAKSWEAFGCSPDIVMAAFAYAGLKEATKAQAADFIESFKSKSA